MSTFYGKLAQDAHTVTLVKAIIPEAGSSRVGSRSIVMSLWLNQLEEGDFANVVNSIHYTDGHYRRESFLKEIPAEEFERVFKSATESY